MLILQGWGVGGGYFCIVICNIMNEYIQIV